MVPGNTKNNSSIAAAAAIAKVKVTLLPVNLSTRFAVYAN